MPLLNAVSRAIHWALPPENPARNFVAFSLFTLVCSCLGCWIGASNDDHALIGVITGLCFSLAASQAVILYYSGVWLGRFAAPEDQASVYAFDDPVLFARRKLEVISRLEPQALTHKIYAVSNCNLFGRPDGSSPEEIEAVRSVNARLFTELARLAVRSDDGKLKVLLQFIEKEQGDAEHELISRIRILNAEIGKTQRRRWERSDFDVKRLNEISKKDYLVIADHVFKTIHMKEQTKYLHVKGRRLATSYREWLEDLFHNGGAEVVELLPQVTRLRESLDRS